MMYELGNWMAAVVLPTPAGPNMNSLSRLVTASGFLARKAMAGLLWVRRGRRGRSRAPPRLAGDWVCLARRPTGKTHAPLIFGVCLVQTISLPEPERHPKIGEVKIF